MDGYGGLLEIERAVVDHVRLVGTELVELFPQLPDGPFGGEGRVPGYTWPARRGAVQSQSDSMHTDGSNRTATNGATLDFPVPGGPVMMRTAGGSARRLGPLSGWANSAGGRKPGRAL